MRATLLCAAIAALVLSTSVSAGDDKYLRQMQYDGTIVACVSSFTLEDFTTVGLEEGTPMDLCRVISPATFDRDPVFHGWKFLTFPGQPEEFKAWAEDSPLVLKLDGRDFLPTRLYTFYVDGCELIGLWPYPVDPHLYDQDLLGPENVLIKTGVTGLACPVIPTVPKMQNVLPSNTEDIVIASLTTP